MVRILAAGRGHPLGREAGKVWGRVNHSPEGGPKAQATFRHGRAFLGAPRCTTNTPQACEGVRLPRTRGAVGAARASACSSPAAAGGTLRGAWGRLGADSKVGAGQCVCSTLAGLGAPCGSAPASRRRQAWSAAKPGLQHACQQCSVWSCPKCDIFNTPSFCSRRAAPDEPPRPLGNQE